MPSRQAVHAPEPGLSPGMIAGLGVAWASVHRDLPVAISRDMRHYLTLVAMSSDDDLLAALLLKKLAISTGDPCDRHVGINSTVTFAAGSDDPPRTVRLVHRADDPGAAERIGVHSRLGAGLVGLSAGAAFLWPGDDGQLRSIRVIDVAID